MIMFIKGMVTLDLSSGRDVMIVFVVFTKKRHDVRVHRLR